MTMTSQDSVGKDRHNKEQRKPVQKEVHKQGALAFIGVENMLQEYEDGRARWCISR